jgi:hypothetical protein
MRPGSSRPTRVLAVLPSRLPSAQIYILKPLSALARAGQVVLDVALEASVQLGQILWSDVVAFCRNIEPAAEWVMEEALAHGKATTYDLDDDLWGVPFDSEYGLYYRDVERVRTLESFLRRATVVRVYNRRLRERVMEFNPRVKLLRPGIDSSRVPKEPVRRDDGAVRITYASGRGVADPLVSIFADALLDVLASHPETEAVFWHEVPRPFRGHPRARSIPAVDDFDAYLGELSSGRYDIGLAPLLGTDFYLCKTDTKFRDYGASRVAGVYSDVEVYASVIHGDTGLVVPDDANEWRGAMERLVIDHDLRRQIRDRAHRAVVDGASQAVLEADWSSLLAEIASECIEPSLGPVGSSASMLQAAPASPVRIALTGEVADPAGFDGLAQMRSGKLVSADSGEPLPSNHADLVFVELSSRIEGSLEEVLREAQRIGRHGSQVSIVAPYAWRSGAEVHPPRLTLDENTPREWTACPDTLVPPEEYAGEAGPRWGMGRTAGLDLRCLRLEFVYAPGYRSLPPARRRLARRREPGACEWLLCQLVVVKEPMQLEEMKAMERETRLYEPQFITTRRLEEANEALRSAYGDLRRTFDGREDDLGHMHALVAEGATEVSLLREAAADAVREVEVLRSALGEATTELGRMRTAVVATEKDLQEVRAARDELRSAVNEAMEEVRNIRAAGEKRQQEAMEEVRNIRAAAEKRQQEAMEEVRNIRAAGEKRQQEAMEEVRNIRAAGEKRQQEAMEEVRNIRAAADRQQQEMSSLELELARSKGAARRLAETSEARRRSLPYRLRERFVDRTGLANRLGTAFRQIQDDADLFLPSTNGWILSTSGDLRGVPFVPYSVNVDRGALNEVLLAFRADVGAETGTLGLEIVSATNKEIVVQTVIPAPGLDLEAPVRFQFAALGPDVPGTIEFRVFARDLDVAVRALEWRRRRLGGLRKSAAELFFGLGFAGD